MNLRRHFRETQISQNAILAADACTCPLWLAADNCALILLLILGGKKASVSWLGCILFVIRWSWGENGRLNLHIVTRKNKGESGNEPGARSLSNICPAARLNIYPTYLGKISPPPFPLFVPPYMYSHSNPLSPSIL